MHPLLAQPRRYLASAALVVVAVGITGALLSGVNAMQRNQDLMLSRAVTAAAALPALEIAQLHGSERDLENSTYQSIKRRLYRVRQENPGMRFVHLYGRRPNGQIFNYIDSEPPSSGEYTPPGLIVTDPSSQMRAAFVEDTPYIEKPGSFGYGSWISAFAPVVDETSGEIVALLSIDISSYDYYSQIAMYMLVPLLLAAVPLSVLLRNRRLEQKEREVLHIKSQFVSVASHDLRAPLTGAMWGIQSLLKMDKKFTKKQKDILTAVFNSTATSLASVNEVLDFSIFDRGKADKLQHVDVDLVAVLKDVQTILALSAQQMNVKIKFKGKWPRSIMVNGDPGAIKRAFSNIVSNAVKYSNENTNITLSYKKDDSFHVIEIKDHGIGIPKKEQEKVLAGYYRASNASKRLAHGTGIGLWITRLIVEQHDGELHIDSKVDKGTTVSIRLPDASVGPTLLGSERQ